MANVAYEKTKTEPAGRKLIFRREAGELVSQNLTLGFDIIINQFVKKPIPRIELVFEMLYPSLYEFEKEGKADTTFTCVYTQKKEKFSTGDINFRIKIKNPSEPLEREVIFKVIVMDAEERYPFPLGGNYGFYSWEPIPPPSGTLLYGTPNQIL